MGPEVCTYVFKEPVKLHQFASFSVLPKTYFVDFSYLIGAKDTSFRPSISGIQLIKMLLVQTYSYVSNQTSSEWPESRFINLAHFQSSKKTCFMDSRWVFTNKYGCLWSNILVSHVIKLIQGLNGHSRPNHPARFEPLVKRLILA